MDKSIQSRLVKLDQSLIQFMQRYSIDMLRYSLSIVFIWFGLLKVIGLSPVQELVSRTVYWFPPKIFVPILGMWEILIGYGLLFGVLLRWTLLLFELLLIGTFSVLIFMPHIAFQNGNPFLLTMEGEFIIKNLVLITAGIVIGGTIKGKS